MSRVATEVQQLPHQCWFTLGSARDGKSPCNLAGNEHTVALSTSKWYQYRYVKYCSNITDWNLFVSYHNDRRWDQTFNPGITCMEQEASVGSEIRVDTVSFGCYALLHYLLTEGRV